MTVASPITYTYTDEAPALATYSLLPILRAFGASAGIEFSLMDISLAGRILASFPDVLPPDQRQPDALQVLGEAAKTPEANIIKLPNISASVPQLKAAIAELQAKGYALPSYPDEPKNEEERAFKARYDRIKGSAVNPVLREGNSDRRAPKAVKAHARVHPPRMGAWSKDVKTHVATMAFGDFRANEQSVTCAAATSVRIEHVDASGTTTTLIERLPLEAGEIMDATFLSKRALLAFLEQSIEDAKTEGLLFSLHLKATMMKVSDPILFGHAVKTFFRSVFAKHHGTLERLGVDANNGLGDLLAKIKSLPASERQAIEADLEAAYAEGPALAMVNSDEGMTNLHVPNDVIIDASMPAMIRDSGCMWNKEGKLQETKAVIPDSSYAGVYQAVIDSCKADGTFDPKTMGSVANVGLMARKAEEYGSHDKTFEIRSAGTVQVVDVQSGSVLIRHAVEEGDIWRACQTKDDAIRDWVKLAVARAKATGSPTIFWLDKTRAHDAELIKKVTAYLGDEDTEGCKLDILDPERATKFSVEAIRKGEDVISVTGNVLRDYLTDLFPILEVGTSAKMLSIVPLMNGGGLFETGAGGSAPKHVQQFEKEGHLRWDSLGEFLAVAASFEHLSQRTGNKTARLLAQTLDEASTQYLMNDRSPSRRAKELDNRGTHFYLALYWAEALAEQNEDPQWKKMFAPIARELSNASSTILQELNDAQGAPVELGGYYRPNAALAEKAMRPSQTFNAIIDGMQAP